MNSFPEINCNEMEQEHKEVTPSLKNACLFGIIKKAKNNNAFHSILAVNAFI